MAVMKTYENQVFERFYDQDSGAVFENLEFRRCQFESSAISIARDPQLRSTVRNVRLIRCEEIGCGIESAIIENVLVDGLKTSDLLQTWAAVYKHVTLKGKIGRIMISPFLATGGTTPKKQIIVQAQKQAFDEANDNYYRTIDWALDISQAEFKEADIRGVPARLILRDPETQVVVTRQKALQGGWQELDLEETWWGLAIDHMLEREEPDIVLVAPKRHRNFKRLLEGLNLLREAGVAEPD